MPKYKDGVYNKYVNFEGDYENVGILIKSYAIEHNIPPFNRIKDKSLIY